ncbi:MAG TPA: hypothetical protein VHZ81_14155 [Galbitalea sp.]|jgi:hypothetical protein|nr:hypothetical protein [Galbitalea sp.]
MRNSNARNSKKRIAAVAIITLILVGGGGAATYAYWSAGGSGTGSATTGTSAGISAIQTTTVSNLAPGSAAQPLSGNFTNTNSGPVYVTSVVASITSVTKAGSPVTGCDATDYTLTSPTMSVAAEIPAGSAQGNWSGATLAFNNKITNQDACKGATVNLSYAIN